MKKGMKRTLLAFMVMAMLASSAAVPAMASNGENPTGGGTSVMVLSDGEEGTDGQNGELSNGLPAAVEGVITLSGTASYTLTGAITSPIKVEEGANITINLNGQNISSDTGHTIENHGTITITGTGTVSNGAAGKSAFFNIPNATAYLYGGTFEDGYYYTIKNFGTMTIDGATVKRAAENDNVDNQNGSSLIANGWYATTDAGYTHNEASGTPTLIIKSGTFDGGLNVIKNDDYGVLTINGGTFQNSMGQVILNWNEATINGGTFSASNQSLALISNGYINDTADKGQLTINGGTFTTTTQSQTIFSYGEDASQNSKGYVAINGGVFEGRFPVSVPYELEITGGSYTSNPQEYLTDDVEAMLSNSGKTRFGVYRNLQDAVDDANAGDMVTVYQSGLTAVVDENSGIRFETAEGVTKPTLVPPASKPEEEPEEEETYIPSTPISDGWHHYSSGSMYYQDGKRTRGWAEIDGARYYFDEKGYMAAGWLELEDGWYYFAEDGKMETGWLQLGNTWYYLDPETGRMYDNGLATIGKYTYYFYDWGGMANSWWYEDENGGWYFFGGDGAMKAAQWVEWKGEWYYLTESGKMAVSTEIGGYTVNADGVWVG